MLKSTKNLRHVKQFDPVSAEQFDIIVSHMRKNLNLDGMVNTIGGMSTIHRNGGHKILHRPVAGDTFLPGEIMAIKSIHSVSDDRIVYETETYSSDNTANQEFLINELITVRPGEQGGASFGEVPTLAKATSSPSSFVTGRHCGPTHGSQVMNLNKPGFRCLGDSTVATDLIWVQRVREHCRGVALTDGGTGTPATFEVDGVNFISGFDAWDGTNELVIYNIYGDTIEDGLVVSFNWNMATQHWETENIECP
jgi:hypothetical protein